MWIYCDVEEEGGKERKVEEIASEEEGRKEGRGGDCQDEEVGRRG